VRLAEAAHVLHQRAQLRRLVAQALARLGQSHAARGALEQGHAQRILQPADALADRRPGHAQRVGRGAEAGRVRHGQEHAQEVEVGRHWLASLTAESSSGRVLSTDCGAYRGRRTPLSRHRHDPLPRLRRRHRRRVATRRALTRRPLPLFESTRTAMNDNIHGKVVLVTGASSGIGETTARILAARGATVVLGARRVERLEALAADIDAAGGTALARALDVTSRGDVQAFAEHALQRFGRIDVLVNNAGVMPLAPLSALKVDEWDRMIDVNIRGVLTGIAAVLAMLERQGHGHVVNVSSIGGLLVMPTAAVYCATKYEVRAISDGLRMESDTVRVTCVYPGAVESELASTIT